MKGTVFWNGHGFCVRGADNQTYYTWAPYGYEEGEEVTFEPSADKMGNLYGMSSSFHIRYFNFEPMILNETQQVLMSNPLLTSKFIHLLIAMNEQAHPQRR